MIRRILLCAALLVPLCVSAQTYVYLDRSPTPIRANNKVLFLPPDVAVSEISAGGVIEKVPDWGKQSREYVAASVRKFAPQGKFELIEMPTLTDAERELVEQHTALYLLLAGTVRTNGLGGGDVWTKRLESGITDYTIGPGLAFLAEKTGADTALFTIVEDFVSSSERKALMVFGAVFGVVIPLGRTFAVTGLVDLKSGRLLWQSYDTSGTPDMRIAKDAETVMMDVLRSFPRFGSGGPLNVSTSLAPALIAVFWLVSAQAAGLPAFTDGATVVPADGDEARVWSQGEEFDDMLRRSGRLLLDPELTAYVQGVMDRLFPEFKGRTRVRIVKSPQLNAFALPNGSIYINQGLLARFQNESQLATVLAHEGTHFTHRHGHRQMQNAKSTAAFGTFLAVIGVPVVGLVGSVLAASSISGYSRELETEADNHGYPRMVAAGYDPRESPKAFAHLIAELKATEIDEPFFFSSHPKLQERYENFMQLSAKTPVPENLAPDEYAIKMRALRIANLENEHSMGRYKQMLLVLDDSEQLKNYPVYAPYYLGEAYRQRGKSGDDELMEKAYRSAIEAAPEFAPSYRALGVFLLKKGMYEDAEKQLEKYLALTQNPADRKYAEAYLELAHNKGQKQ